MGLPYDFPLAGSRSSVRTESSSFWFSGGVATSILGHSSRSCRQRAVREVLRQAIRSFAALSVGVETVTDDWEGGHWLSDTVKHGRLDMRFATLRGLCML